MDENIEKVKFELEYTISVYSLLIFAFPPIQLYIGILNMLLFHYLLENNILNCCLSLILSLLFVRFYLKAKSILNRVLSMFLMIFFYFPPMFYFFQHFNYVTENYIYYIFNMISLFCLLFSIEFYKAYKIYKQKRIEEENGN